MLISRSQAADIARRVRALQSRGVLLGGQIRCCEALGLSFSPIFFFKFQAGHARNRLLLTAFRGAFFDSSFQAGMRLSPD